MNADDQVLKWPVLYNDGRSDLFVLFRPGLTQGEFTFIADNISRRGHGEPTEEAFGSLLASMAARVMTLYEES